MGIVFFFTAGILLYDASERFAALEEFTIPSVFGALIAAT